MLSLLDLQVGHQFLIFRHKFAMNLGLLAHRTLQHLDLLRQRSYVVFILLHQGSNRVPAEQLRKAIVCQIRGVGHLIFVLSGGKRAVDDLIDLRLLTSQE